MMNTVEHREQRRLFGLRAPAVVLVVALYLLPLVLILAYSFLESGRAGSVQWVPSLDAYRELLRPDPRASTYNGYVTLLVRSSWWAVLATLVTLALSLPLATFIAGRRSTLAKNALLVAVVIPFWTSMLVRIYAVRFLLANGGPVNGWLEALGLERRVFLNTPGIVFAGLVYTALPFMVLPLYAAIERADRNVINAARDLGANPFQVFFTVFVPLVRAGVIAGCMLVFVLSVSQYLVPTLLGGGKANMIANVIENQFNESQNWPLGSAISVFLVVFSLIGTWWSVRFDEETN